MAGFASFDELIESITVDDQVLDMDYAKLGTAPEVAGVWHSLWRVGNVPAAGSDGAAGSGTPGAGGAVADQTGLTTGWADTSPATKHLTTWEGIATQDCTLMLYDRLVSVSGITLVGTGNKNINSTALTRYTDGIGVEVWLEVSTVTATSAVVVSMNSYTDQGGTGSNSGGSITFPAAATNVDTLVGPMPLASGDYGVRSVETINVSTASGGSGACNLVLLKPIAYLPLGANLANVLDFVSMIPSLPRIYDGASLGIAQQASSTTATNTWGKIRAAYR